MGHLARSTYYTTGLPLPEKIARRRRVVLFPIDHDDKNMVEVVHAPFLRPDLELESLDNEPLSPLVYIHVVGVYT